MGEDSKIIKKLHPHPLAFLSFYFSGSVFILAGILFLPLLIIFGIALFLLGEVSRRAESFIILESGVEKTYNLLSTSVKFIEYNKIQNIEVKQSFFEKFFSIGTIKFDTAGTNGIELYFYAIPDPYGVEKIIREKMTAK